MPRPRKVPWVAIQIDILRSEKVAKLPSDAAILGWLSVLLEAKTQRRMGVFDSDRHFRLVMGRFGRYLTPYIRAKLMERAGELCDRCLDQYPDVGSGAVVVHDYRREQRDPTHATRQDRYRADSDGGRDAVSDAESDGKETPVSRAGPTTTTVTETLSTSSREPGKATQRSRTPSSSGRPSTATLLTREQLDAWDSFTAEAWQPFKEAWLGRGLLWPPAGDPDDDDTSQRGLLWQIAQARPNDLGRWVRGAKGRTAREVITAVLQRWHDVRAEAGTEDPEWADTKAEDRRTAGRAMARVGEVGP